MGQNGKKWGKSWMAFSWLYGEWSFWIYWCVHCVYNQCCNTPWPLTWHQNCGREGRGTVETRFTASESQLLANPTAIAAVSECLHPLLRENKHCDGNRMQWTYGVGYLSRGHISHICKKLLIFSVLEITESEHSLTIRMSCDMKNNIFYLYSNAQNGKLTIIIQEHLLFKIITAKYIGVKEYGVKEPTHTLYSFSIGLQNYVI